MSVFSFIRFLHCSFLAKGNYFKSDKKHLRTCVCNINWVKEQIHPSQSLNAFKIHHSCWQHMKKSPPVTVQAVCVYVFENVCECILMSENRLGRIFSDLRGAAACFLSLFISLDVVTQLLAMLHCHVSTVAQKGQTALKRMHFYNKYYLQLIFKL